MIDKKYQKYYRRVLKHKCVSFKLKDPTKEEKTLRILFENMREISILLSNLRDSKKYVWMNPSKSKYSKKNIPMARYLNYHLHSYLNNLYILEERIKSFLKKIKRATNNSQLKDSISKFEINIIEILKETRNIRNNHVHQARYIDEDISRLESFEDYLKTDFNSIIISKKHISMAYSKVKAEWLKYMKNNNDLIADLISKYFDFITTCIIDEDGSFKILLKKYSYENSRKY